MVPGWRPQHSAIVARYIFDVLARTQYVSDLLYEVVEETQALPAYASLVILPSTTGELLFQDLEGGPLRPLRDEPWEREEHWETTALVNLAEKYPDLADLRPARPESALDRDVCLGARVVP